MRAVSKNKRRPIFNTGCRQFKLFLSISIPTARLPPFSFSHLPSPQPRSRINPECFKISPVKSGIQHKKRKKQVLYISLHYTFWFIHKFKTFFQGGCHSFLFSAITTFQTNFIFHNFSDRNADIRDIKGQLGYSNNYHSNNYQ